MRVHGSRIAGATLLLVAGLSGCGSTAPELAGVEAELPETAVLYSVTLEGMPTEETTELAEEALAVYRYQDRGATSLALLKRRAENDLDTIQQILRSYGYYNGTAEVEVEDLDEEEFDEVARTSAFKLPSLSDLAFWHAKPPSVEDVATEFARVSITVEPGEQFTLASHDFILIDPESGAVVPSPRELGSPVGSGAEAAPIVGAEAAAVEMLQLNGYPYAERIDRDAVANLELATLAIETPLFSGPSSVFGQVEFSGLEDVKESYLRTYIPWQEGDPVSTGQVRDFTRALLATDLFSTAVVTLPEEPPELDGPVPLTVQVEADERPFRTISAGAEYATDDGPGANVAFEHRNLWGSNETASVQAKAALELQQLTFGYREPQWHVPGQDLLASLTVLNEEHEGFDELRVTATGGLERKLTDRWTIGYGGLAEASRIRDDGKWREAYLGGIPIFAAYDSTDDLLNPTRGLRTRVDLTPFAGTFASEFTNFFVADTNASTYWDILGGGDYILAARARLGSIIAGDLSDVPNNRRLYSGGGGSVRGYARDEIGPLDEDNDPVGGRSVVEASLEMRAKLYGDLGGVVFVDAGEVDSASVPDFDDVRYAAGVGVRYYSMVGPIRLDVAFPVNPRDIDDSFQLYFSIGQAF